MTSTRTRSKWLAALFCLGVVVFTGCASELSGPPPSKDSSLDAKERFYEAQRLRFAPEHLELYTEQLRKQAAWKAGLTR